MGNTVKINNGVNENGEITNPNIDALSPFMFGIRIAGSLTPQDLGPSTGLVIPLFRNRMPFAFLSVVLLDFLAALAVKRSMITDAHMPDPFEAAWRNPQQSSFFAARPISQQNAPANEVSAPANGASIEPLFFQRPDQGLSLTVVLEAPLDSRHTESSAVFTFLLMECPRIPAFILPIVALTIYVVNHFRWKSMSQ